MAEGLNQVTLLGNIGKDPELREAGESKVLRFRMATTERYKQASGDWADKTEWHTVTVFGARAEGLSRVLAKGDRVCVTGSLHTSEWQAQDGSKRQSTEINARGVFLCGGKGGNAGQERDRTPPPAASSDVDPDLGF
jgi:single-strand DNA-binding protein